MAASTLDQHTHKSLVTTGNDWRPIREDGLSQAFISCEMLIKYTFTRKLVLNGLYKGLHT